MTLATMQQKLARRRNGNAASIGEVTKARYEDHLNEAHRRILRRATMTSLRAGQVTFASVALQPLYALPMHGVARINRITETVNDRKLEYRTGSWLDTVDPDPPSGTPWAWVPRGYSEAHTRPSAPTALFAVSTSALDVGLVYVEGMRTGGYLTAGQAVMTGTSALQVGAATDVIQVTRFYLSNPAVGTVTLHAGIGLGTELSRIAPGDTHAQFITFQLYNTPSGVTTYYCDILRSIPDMTQPNDEPLLPPDFHDLLVDMAELAETKKADDAERYAMLSRTIETGLAQLTTFVVTHPEFAPVGALSEQPSRLGAWFPSGS